MAKQEDAEKISAIIQDSKHVVVVQADNPDTDSLCSSLALEHIFEDMGKRVTLYCGVDLPSYLQYLPGSDRVVKELPKSFDASVIVDTSSNELLEQLDKQQSKSWLAAKPCIIIDHHVTEPTITFADVIYNQAAVATGEVIYELATKLEWPMNKNAKKLIAIAILSDSLGLMSESTSARSIHIIAELVDGGVSLAEIENARRETMRRDPELIHYKGRLLQRVEFYNDNKIALLTIPWEEIEMFSPLYNPPMLVIDDMRLGKGTDIAICFKLYRDGKITAKIRTNFGVRLADKLAEYFGGGGHPYASGFKIQDGRQYRDIKAETIAVATELLKKAGDLDDKAL